MGDMLRKCLNWKVLAGLAAVGLAVWVLAPGLAAGAIPLLIVLVCPLSMLLMMRGMHGEESSVHGRTEPTNRAQASSVQELPEFKTRRAELEAERQTLSREIARLEEDEDRQSQGRQQTRP